MINVERLSKDVGKVLHKDVASQWRGVNLYMKKIKDEIGDILDACSDLIEKNTDVGCYDKYGNRSKTNLDFDYYDRNISHIDEDKRAKEGEVFVGNRELIYCIDIKLNCLYESLCLIIYHLDSLMEWERHDTIEVINWRKRVLADVKKACKVVDENTYYECVIYNEIRETMEYRVCRKVLEYLSNKRQKSKPNKELRYDAEFMVSIKAVFLYVALKNELKRIKEQAYIEGVELQEVEKVAVSPENKKAKRMSVDEIKWEITDKQKEELNEVFYGKNKKGTKADKLRYALELIQNYGIGFPKYKIFDATFPDFINRTDYGRIIKDLNFTYNTLDKFD